jgi:hypothetical protein
MNHGWGNLAVFLLTSVALAKLIRYPPKAVANLSAEQVELIRQSAPPKAATHLSAD